jgi:alpha-ketoglutarate-dependent taurine dioxygenase
MTDTIGTHVRIDVRGLSGNIGAEITGVDTGTGLGDDVIAQIRQALLEHKVVFLRDDHQGPGVPAVGHPDRPDVLALP